MLLVQKYGGTSVGSLELIESIAKRSVDLAAKGNQLVIIVSAMSGETNKLTSYINFFSKSPNNRDADMVLSSGEMVTSGLLSIAINEKNQKATSLTGWQANINTCANHQKAKIQDIQTKNIQNLLDDGHIVVIAGFQGIDNNNNITTLGRGGSDLSAVAIAGALKADTCEIYTDVDGVFTTDPRIIKKAKKIDVIDYDSMLELSGAGAKVLHNRSVELAKKLNIKLIIKNTFTNNSGTLITHEDNIMEQPIVSGIALDKSQSRISLIGVEDVPGIAADIFSKLSDADIQIDMIVQNIAHDGKTNIDLSVSTAQLTQAKETLEIFNKQVSAIEYDSNISKISIVGVGMKSHSGVASKTFSALSQNNINIMMISTSEIKISVIVNEKDGENALEKLHTIYGLDK